MRPAGCGLQHAWSGTPRPAGRGDKGVRGPSLPRAGRPPRGEARRRRGTIRSANVQDARRPVIGSDALAAFANLDKRDDTLLSAYEAKASVVLHTALPCDASVLKPYVVPALKAVCPDAPEYVKAQALLHHLAPFDVILKDALPAHAHVAALLSEAK